MFYRGTDICVFVYDVTNPASLENVHKWKQQYAEAQSSTMDGHTVFAVFGNKVRDVLLLVANHRLINIIVRFVAFRLTWKTSGWFRRSEQRTGVKRTECPTMW